MRDDDEREEKGTNIHGVAAVLVKNIKDLSCEFWVVGGADRFNERIARDAAVFVCTLLERLHDALVLGLTH